MPYAIARYAGYCAGVRKAMETAFQAANAARDIIREMEEAKQ